MRTETECTLGEGIIRLIANRPSPVDGYRNVTAGLNRDRPATLVEWNSIDLGTIGMALFVKDDDGYATEIAYWKQRKP